MSLVAVSVFLLVFAFSRLELLYSHKFYDVTWRAEWIWAQHQMSSGSPVAFFATRDFDLPPNRYFTRIKILGDPEYTLYFNGIEIGGRRVGDEPAALDVFDVSKLAVDKGNRIVVAVRSPNGVGGLIASVDITPEFQNFIVTGSDWHIVNRWRDDLIQRDPPSSTISRPQLLGRPPARRWNFLARQEGKRAAPVGAVIAPRASFEFKTALPVIVMAGDVAVTALRPTRATAFDFGPTAGRVRLTFRDSGGGLINVRFANQRSELFTIEGSSEQFVFAPGERVITDPPRRQFRYVMVYGSRATTEVVQ